MRIAATKMSLRIVVPTKFAMTTVRKKPMIREIRVPEKSFNAPRNILRDIDADVSDIKDKIKKRPPWAKARSSVVWEAAF